MKNHNKYFVLVLFLYFIQFCVIAQGFEKISSRKSGVKFQNKLVESQQTNILTYEYFYNGGGVAIGDINNDGLDDLFFTGNMTSNKLYLNQGDFKFKDIGKSSGTLGKDAWTTGATMVDVNGDGYLDIYVCYSGKGDVYSRKNELLINQKDNTFIDEAEKYGLADPANSIQAAFFDFDLDGDLDMYLLNHNTQVINEIDFDAKRKDRNPLAGDKLFRNDNGVYIDISEEAGIIGNSMGFGLGIAIADITGNGYPDIHISNDYIEPDYLYINNGDGTFSEKLTEYLQHISYYSMGSDFNDVNNDGLVDLFTLDMLPEDNERQKLLYGPENYEQYALMVMKGFYHQNMRNMLHINQGTGMFSEIGQLSGMSNTDWSWAAFFTDFDNDGWKDLFVSNGYYRDYTNRDFLKYKGDYYFSKARAKEKADTLHLVTSMSSTPIHDYVFRNENGAIFKDVSKDWGFEEPNFSNGAAYSDLNRDGALDLVVNHLNDFAGIYANVLAPEENEGNYLQLKLKGEGSNTSGIGAKINVYIGEQQQYFEQQPTRGFQSSVSHVLHIGLGTADNIDSLKITWLGGKQQWIRNIASNQLLQLDERKALDKEAKPEEIKSSIFTKIVSPIPFKHVEAGYNDFKRQPLLPHMLSPSGPVIAVGDVNNNGYSDVFIGGTSETPGKLYFQVSTGQFLESQGLDLSDMKGSATTDAVFFDADGDGKRDLFIVNGGYHDFERDSPELKDRLYTNQGGGNFKYQANALPNVLCNSSVAKPIDIDNDGDLDLFIGGRAVPGQYPKPASSFVFINNGNGKFEDHTDKFFPEISTLGMVTDASWIDVNQDGWQDLVVIGDWMPISVFVNQEGKSFIGQTAEYFDKPLVGKWSKLEAGDFDKDGDIDFIVGNFGTNSQLKATDQGPLTLVYADFDGNGSVDPILNYYYKGELVPFMSRDELLDQMYGMRSKFTDYASFSKAKLEDLFSKEALKQANKLEINELKTIYLENKGNKFLRHELPVEAQYAPVFTISVMDIDGDGNLDFILGGNLNTTRLRLGMIDANFGQVYLGDGKGEFSTVDPRKTGLAFLGDVKNTAIIDLSHLKILLVGINNQGIEAYVLNSSLKKKP